MKKNSTPRRIRFLAGVNGFTVALAFQLAPLAQTARAAPQDSGPVVRVEQAPISRDSKAAASFAPVFRRVTPSVVNIFSTLTLHDQPNPLLNDPILKRFFGDDSGDSAH